MEYTVYCVRDEKMDMSRYGALICQENDAAAMRSFAHECMKEDSLWHSHPSDYSLWKLATYYMATGELISYSPEKVCEATDFVRKDK